MLLSPYTAPVGVDACGGSSTVQIAGLPSGSGFPVGATTNSFFTRDVANNDSTCSFVVTVRELQPPVIICPADIIQSTTASTCDNVVTYTDPVGTDNCPGVVTSMGTGLGSGGTFPLGVNVEQWIVADASGNGDTCTFTITINDDTDPVVTCQNDTTITSAPPVVVNYLTPTATDNCPSPTVSLSAGFGVGGSFPLGTKDGSLGCYRWSGQYGHLSN